jgi:hypothetical protein
MRGGEIPLFTFKIVEFLLFKTYPRKGIFILKELLC